MYNLEEVQKDLKLTNSDLAKIMMVTEGTIRNWRKNGLPKREALFMQLLAAAGQLKSKRTLNINLKKVGNYRLKEY